MTIIADHNRYPQVDAETYRRMIAFAFSDEVSVAGELVEKERATALHLTIPGGFLSLYRVLFNDLQFIILTHGGLLGKQRICVEAKK